MDCFTLEDGTGAFFRNVGNKITTNTAQHSRKPKTSTAPRGSLKSRISNPLKCVLIFIFLCVLFFFNTNICSRSSHNSTISIPCTCLGDYSAIVREFQTSDTKLFKTSYNMI
jgi:hypothetical protein